MPAKWAVAVAGDAPYCAMGDVFVGRLWDARRSQLPCIPSGSIPRATFERVDDRQDSVSCHEVETEIFERFDNSILGMAAVWRELFDVSAIGQEVEPIGSPLQDHRDGGEGAQSRTGADIALFEPNPCASIHVRHLRGDGAGYRQGFASSSH